MHSLEKSYFSLDIKEVFGYNNETGFIDFTTHVELHFDKSNKDLKIFSGQDENGNSIYLILKEGKCSNYNVKDKP